MLQALRKEGILVKHSLNKFLILLGLLALFWTHPVAADHIAIFIKITDATTAVQNEDQKRPGVIAEFSLILNLKTTMIQGRKKVSQALAIKG